MMEPKEINKNQANALVANEEALKAFKTTVAYKLLKSWIDDKAFDQRNKWVKASPVDAEAYRQRAAAYLEMLDFIETQIKVGDVYNDMLKKEALAQATQERF